MINTDELTVDHFFDPSSKNFIDDPKPTIEKLVKEFPIARFNAWSAWLVTGNKNITDCLLDRRLSTDFNLWEHAPPKKELADMDAFEKLMNNNLFFLNSRVSYNCSEWTNISCYNCTHANYSSLSYNQRFF